MRKEPPLLEHVSDAPAVRGHENAGIPIREDAPGGDHLGLSRLHQPSDHIQHCRLARTRRPKKRDELRSAPERHIEREVPLPMPEYDLDHVSRPDPATRRVKSSEAITARRAIEMATTLSRSAPASPPGTCV